MKTGIGETETREKEVLKQEAGLKDKNLRVYVIVLNYNNWQDTIECLESVLRNDYQNFRLVVVDNNSPNGSLGYIKLWAEGKLNCIVPPNHPLRSLVLPEEKKPLNYSVYTQEQLEGGRIADASSLLTLIQTKENLGFAGGINIALKFLLQIRASDDALVWILNPDMVIETKAISFIVRCFKEVPDNKIICGTKVKDYHNPQATLFLGGAKIYKYLGIVRFVSDEKEVKNLDYISGGSLITSLRTFRDVGLFSEEYFLYWEDADWCTRAKLKGYKFKVCNDCVVYDKGGTSIGRQSRKASYYYTRNYAIYHKKFFGGGFWQYAAISAFSLARLAKSLLKLKFEYARGVYDALKDARKVFSEKENPNRFF